MRTHPNYLLCCPPRARVLVLLLHPQAQNAFVFVIKIDVYTYCSMRVLMHAVYHTHAAHSEICKTYLVCEPFTPKTHYIMLFQYITPLLWFMIHDTRSQAGYWARYRTVQVLSVVLCVTGIV
jgi:hypothetical protein